MTNSMGYQKIAIVEDDFLLALVLKKHLEKEGFECATFTNAVDFFNFFSTNPNLKAVILDVKIKGEMNGINLFENFTKISNVPVIFSTGNSEIKEFEPLKSKQVKGILIKPIFLEDLSKIVSLLD